jgi:hypothetical protein
MTSAYRNPAPVGATPHRRLTTRLAAAGAAAGVGLLAGGTLLAASAAAESPSPTLAELTTVGTSFLTAATVKIDQPVSVAASTGDYLYWAFPARAGDTAAIAVSVTLPKAEARHGAQTWSIDVFDGLRRRQACTAGAQAPVADATVGTAELGCVLREVRSWAEPWSGDPLPGTYYIRVSAIDLPDEDLGLPITVAMRVTAEHSDDPYPEGGELAAPLDPAVKAGKVRASAPAEANPSPSEEADDQDWIPSASSRWAWTAGGGVLAAVAGVAGFVMARRFRRLPGR